LDHKLGSAITENETGTWSIDFKVVNSFEISWWNHYSSYKGKFPWSWIKVLIFWKKTFGIDKFFRRIYTNSGEVALIIRWSIGKETLTSVWLIREDYLSWNSSSGLEMEWK